MDILHEPAALRARLKSTPAARSARVAFVPTMGSLHEGHLQLVDEARRRAGEGGLVVASVFVNPLQFGPGEDFDSYPRDLDRDAGLLRGRGCDVVFAPAVKHVYPVAQTFRVLTPPELGGVLEGAFRPGFFEGVCTVVLKLLNLVQPDVAVFGSKDYQQALMVRHMVCQFNLPVEIVAAPTVRAPDGLALSSRNAYLSDAERTRAPQLRQALLQVAQTLSQAAAGTGAAVAESAAESAAVQAVAAAQDAAMAQLRALGWTPDYVEVRRAGDFSLPGSAAAAAAESALRWVVLAAARLGRTRLIDNHEWTLA